MKRKLMILKGVLLFRKFNRYKTKEQQIEECEKYYSDEVLKEWIEALKEDLAKTPKQREKESGEFIERLCDEECETFSQEFHTSCTAHDYSPNNPWDAPGMSICNFI